jgi:hypothetical protein
MLRLRVDKFDLLVHTLAVLSIRFILDYTYEATTENASKMGWLRLL